ncbi:MULTISPECIES: DUF7010 family protein [Reichenbachiella]|uniref:Uncharacterized protein n=1 Tax=Reichenbachiella agariperforans TaxID=156994 RepID=A0A1M6RB44_REIAG|nr:MULTISPECIES: hypothetical protein [Reichenbachiella]MBU2912878.1 hypothetical protein [Reichenbachiella agariperforans]RJE70614.1 hypothetical protein BGP76_11045 [Reichenbachiella sp. MSK19-1]SHK29671.1 hypothetical protein SAMN04488028_104102 [Reichenbachiella agariperforans]
MKTLEQHRIEFSNRPFIATPLAGLIIWLFIGLSGIFLSTEATVWILFIGTGSIVYLAMFLSRFTGENFSEQRKKKNPFDQLFLFAVGQSFLVYAIAIPFFRQDISSLPLAVGILTGTMWLPFTWIIQHWVGIFHAVTRTLGLLALWYIFPDDRFVTIPFAIVAIYIVTLIIFRNRKKQLPSIVTS